jgi:hypothetical protein
VSAFVLCEILSQRDCSWCRDSELLNEENCQCEDDQTIDCETARHTLPILGNPGDLVVGKDVVKPF